MSFSMPEWNMPAFDASNLRSVPEQAFDALVREIKAFQAELTEHTEVGIVANGAGLTIHVHKLRLSDHIVVFTDKDHEGRAARLLQHYTQINVQMVAAPKLEAEPQRIGF